MEKRQGSLHAWGILGVLGIIGIIAVLAVQHDMRSACMLAALSAYGSAASHSFTSRSAVRDSILYHAVVRLMNNLAWYVVLNRLFTNDMTLALFVPYTVATVWGSFTGVGASMWIERRYGITTGKEKKLANLSRPAQKALLGVLGVLCALSVVSARKSIGAMFAIAGLIFGESVASTLLRRSRNTSSAIYHVIASLVHSPIDCFLLRNLSLAGVPFSLFIPYCFGSVLGGLTGQGASAWVEECIGATADKHLEQDAGTFSWRDIKAFIPWRVVAALVFVSAALVALSTNHRFLLSFAVLAAAQQIAFSLVSRSRNRNNMTYHIITAIFSNAVWFLTIRQLKVNHWTRELFLSYAINGAIGSVTGVGISMGIEKKLRITSENS